MNLNELQIFSNEQLNAKIRGLMLDGEVWFIAADICKALNTDNVSQALTRLDNDEKNTIILNEGISGNPTKAIINEARFYRLILSSRKQDEGIKKFQRWVTHEVLPSIRRTGTYSLQQPSQLKGDEVQVIGKMAEDIQSVFAVKRGIALSQAIDLVSVERNLKSLNNLKQLLPPADYETGFMNATELGKKLGGIPPKTVNKMLADANLQYKDGKHWRITDYGSEYGEEMPYTKNGHSGYQVRWNQKIIPLFTQ